MKKVVLNLLLICVLLLTSQHLLGQERKSVTEKFNIPKEQCVVYAYELENYLKSKGLYEGMSTRHTGTNTLKVITRKLNIGGIDFTKDNTFIVALLGSKWYDDDDLSEELRDEDFGIIEIGFKTEAAAKEVYEKAKVACKKYPMNIFLYCPPFRCVLVGKSVLFAYAINVDMDKYRNMAEGWKPDTNEKKY